MGCICEKGKEQKNNNILEKGIPQAIIIDNKKIDISHKKNRKIKEQKEKSICIINGPKKGTGFLCTIPYSKSKNNLLHVLITCNHVLNENIINKKKEIKLSFEYENYQKTLKIDQKRKKYINIGLDIIIIEIKKEEDDLNFVNFLEIDDQILREENLEKIYLKKIFYILHYPQGLILLVIMI
jgi:hypothetical protein